MSSFEIEVGEGEIRAVQSLAFLKQVFNEEKKRSSYHSLILATLSRLHKKPNMKDITNWEGN